MPTRGEGFVTLNWERSRESGLRQGGSRQVRSQRRAGCGLSRVQTWWQAAQQAPGEVPGFLRGLERWGLEPGV